MRILTRRSRIEFTAFACLMALVLASIGVPHPSRAQVQNVPEQIDVDAFNKIKEEEMKHSQVMDTVGYLTDVVGPRLTGSPNLKKAQQYAMDKMREWGITNPHPEAWRFGRGWSLEGFTANMIAPTFGSLIAYPKAWSPSTNGTVRGEVVFLDASTEADLLKYKGRLKDKIVLLFPERDVAANFLPPAQRTSDEDLKKLSEAKPRAAEPQTFQQLSPEVRARISLNYRRWQMLTDEGAAVAVEPGSGDAGTVYVTGATVPNPPDTPEENRRRPWHMNAPKIVPQVVVAAEQYNRMIRILKRGMPVQMEVNIQARYYDADPMSHNIIGEIPGTDLKDEVVMVGGCLDSWTSATGATDNAAGAAVALEVMRLIKSLGLKPRRTIRIGLWSAEEQGAFGSRAYVAEHFGRPGAFTPAYEKFSGYFNLDYGTGKIRGVYLQGNEAVRPIFAAWLAPFKDLGAETVTINGIYSTDHNSFDAIGLPGFQFVRDFMENNPRTAHTNMDVYDHVLADDLKQSAVIATAFIYQAAMRDGKLPRKLQNAR